MNVPLLMGGMVGSAVVIILVVIAICDGIRMTFIVLGALIGISSVLVVLLMFWIWVAGGTVG